MQHERFARGISDAELASVCGGLNLNNLRPSENVEDRRNDPSQQWTPTEDGRIVGPHGEWDWDPSLNQNQPFPYDGQVRPGDVDQESLQRAQEADANLRASPEYQELADYTHDALNGNLTPTEDGHMVGSNGRVYDDPTINQNQPHQEEPYTPQAGEYVGEGNPYPEEEGTGGEGGGGYEGGGYEGGADGGGYEGGEGGGEQ